MSGSTAEPSEPREPMPLYVGVGGTAIVVYIFAFVYGHVGDTTPRGWYATLAAGFELSGVLLVASPELRPIVEKSARRLAAKLRTWPHHTRNFLLRLAGKPRQQEVSLGATVSTEAALGIDVVRWFPEAPPAGATSDRQIAYLLQVTDRFKCTLNVVENDLRKGLEQVRGEIQRTALDLTEQTTDAVRQLAQSELRMRLFGVAFITVGLMLSYAANIA